MTLRRWASVLYYGDKVHAAQRVTLVSLWQCHHSISWNAFNLMAGRRPWLGPVIGTSEIIVLRFRYTDSSSSSCIWWRDSREWISRTNAAYILTSPIQLKLQPHVDNVEASGTWILGISLGDERVMRLESTSPERKKFEIALPSGSIYIQK